MYTLWLPIHIDENSAEPLYHQIKTQLRSLIISEVITEGTLLPSIREFAGELNCSVITVRRVYQDLEGEGMLRTRQGTGTFVSHVGDDAREAYRRDALVKSLEAAVELARSLHSSEEELKRIFYEIVEKKYKEQG